MESITRSNLDNFYSQDRDIQNKAYSALMEETEKPVTWAYEAWDELLAALRHKDNHVRAIAAQLLCNLAKSDAQQRMLKDFDALLAVTKDERFVTARHALQSLWKVGAAGEAQQKTVVAGLEGRFQECISEKNYTLIRYDILDDLKKLYDAAPNEASKESIKAKSLALIESEQDPKYRKKYATLWRPRKGG